MAQEYRYRWADETVRNRAAATTQAADRRQAGDTGPSGAAVFALLTIIAGLLVFITYMVGDGAEAVRLLAALR